MKYERRHARPQPGYTPLLLVAKEDVEQAERMVNGAVQMVDAAMSRYATKVLGKEAALKKFRESAESENRVEAFRRDVLSQEASLSPDSEPGLGIARKRIEKWMDAFEVEVQQDMHDKQAPKSTDNLQRALYRRRPSVPVEFHSATRDFSTPKSSAMQETSSMASLSKPMSRRDESEGLTAHSDGMGPIELSSTGFAHFPRHRNDDDDWGRASQHSTSKPEGVLKPGGKLIGIKGLFGGWFAK